MNVVIIDHGLTAGVNHVILRQSCTTFHTKTTCVIDRLAETLAMTVFKDRDAVLGGEHALATLINEC